MAKHARTVRIREFRLVKLTLVEVGLFREYQEIDFMGEAHNGVKSSVEEPELQPANFFLFLSKNGFGKTTALEAVSSVVDVMGNPNATQFGLRDLDEGTGRIQADFRVTWSIDDRRSAVLLSVWAGSDGPVRAWAEPEIERISNTTQWARVSLLRNSADQRIAVGSGTNELGRIFINAVRDAIDTPPAALFGEGLALPTVLLFPADRTLCRPPQEHRMVCRPDQWGYQSCHRFEVDGSDWNGSLDNLLVWLSWLDDGRDRALREFIEEFVFMDGGKALLEVDRERLSTSVRTADGVHPLFALSHGERQVLRMRCERGTRVSA